MGAMGNGAGQAVAELTAVSKKYGAGAGSGATTALDGLNLTLHAGEIVAMLQVARVTDTLRVRDH